MQPSWRMPGTRRGGSARCFRNLLVLILFCSVAFFGGWVCMYYYLSHEDSELLADKLIKQLSTPRPTPPPLVEKSIDEPCYLYMAGKGRHGNLMFEYAASMCIASQLDRTLIISYRFNELLGSAFRLTAQEPSAYKDANISSFKVFKQTPRCCSFDKRLQNLPRIDIAIDGFLHSWLYFNDCLRRVREEFKFKESLVNQAQDILAKSARKFGLDRTKDSVLFIGVHVRMGERKSISPLPHGDANADVDYFKRAMRYFDGHYPDRNLVYVIVSDSSKAASLIVQHPHAAVVEDKSVEVHMAVLANCDHSIISVGSLGWWTAFLAGGTVVYYNGWPNPVSSVSQMYRLNQYFYPKWIGMS